MLEVQRLTDEIASAPSYDHEVVFDAYVETVEASEES